MDAIKYHINFLFRDAPITDENVRIKKELYLHALDRYEELITLGKTESEALGTVIVEMGDRNELLENQGYGSFGESNQHVFHTLNEARGLITSYNHQASKIGLGIFLILLGAGLVPTLRSFISSTWNYTWIIWPLASILWGIITLIYRQSTHKDFL